mgnify:CR=1 FL=1
MIQIQNQIPKKKIYVHAKKQNVINYIVNVFQMEDFVMDVNVLIV